MNRPRNLLAFVACALIASAPALAQGPASCGFHLDVRSNLTGTHSAVADMPNAPGSGGFAYAPGAPGNPYSAYATPGSPIAFVINGNSLAYGPAPMGPGSCATLIYSVGPPAPGPIALGPPFVATCFGAPHIVGVVPFGGTVVDTCGFLGPPNPVFGLFDFGSGRMILAGTYPPFAPPVAFQAAGITPGGAVWVTNSVSIFPGPNPAEVPVPPVIPCGAFIAADEGQSVGNPTVPGFAFYGFPTPVMDLDVNGFVDFAPGTGAVVPPQGCDAAGTFGDLGCAPLTATARPRIDVNHADYDMSVLPAAPFMPGMTMEFRPPGPMWPDAVIYRWKNMPAFGAPAGIAGLSTAALALELQGGACGCIPPVVPNRIVVVRSWLMAVDQCGIGPGGGMFPPYPPPPVAAPTCGLGAAGLPFMGTFAPPAGLPFAGVPGGVIHMDAGPAGLAVFNSAIVFTPLFGPPPVPYLLTVY